MEQHPSGVAQKDSVKASGNNGETEDNDDIAVAEIEEDETKRKEIENKAQELRYREVILETFRFENDYGDEVHLQVFLRFFLFKDTAESFIALFLVLKKALKPS